MFAWAAKYCCLLSHFHLSLASRSLFLFSLAIMHVSVPLMLALSSRLLAYPQVLCLWITLSGNACELLSTSSVVWLR